MERRRDAAPVEQEDRLAALLGDPAELGQERRRERVAALAPEVDDADARHRRSDPRREDDALERGPALGPRRRAAVDRDRALERRALRGDGARVVARIRLLLERASRAPRRRSRGRGRASARRSPSARRRRSAPRRARCDRARRAARPARAPSGGSRRCPRSAAGTGRPSAARARSPARARSCPSPRASAASQAWRYTSVLPLPVGPTSRRCAAPALVEARDDPRDRRLLLGRQLGRCRPRPAATRAPPATAARRAASRRSGATSSSARAGVVP